METSRPSAWNGFSVLQRCLPRGSLCRGILVLLAAFPMLVPCAWAQSVTTNFRQFHGDVSKPDALIVTSRLSQLPKDVLEVPVLRDLLTQQFAYYYQGGNSGYLSVLGALRRMAFEHDRNVTDLFLTYLFDTPAEIALWKGHDGRLRQYMIVVDQTGLKAFMEALAAIALKDKQFAAGVPQKLPDGSTVPQYILRYSGDRALYLAGTDSRLFISSDPAIPLPVPDLTRTWVERAKAFLGINAEVGVFAPTFGIVPTGRKHVLVASANYLGFGYQKYFPSLNAVKFEYGTNGWELGVLSGPDTAGTGAKAAALWLGVPRGPALCIALPLDPRELGTAATAALPDLGARLATLFKKLDSPLGVCWYAESSPFTPLFVVHATLDAGDREVLKTAFARVIGAAERKTPVAATSQGVAGAVKDVTSKIGNLLGLGGKPAPPPADPNYPRIAVTDVPAPAASGWMREVSSPYGPYKSETGSAAAYMLFPKYFRPKLAEANNYVLFSADDRLIDKALTVAAKRFPSAGEALPATAKGAQLLIAPGTVGKVAHDTILEALSGDQVFRASVSQYLFPNLDKMKTYSNYGAVYVPPTAGPYAWQPVSWIASQAF